ncbi:MAG: cell wall-binding repeat-containing protein [Parcubacteria group bacterium]
MKTSRKIASLFLGLLLIAPVAHAAEPEVVPQIQASLATVEYSVGPGQTYGTLQAALDAIPAKPTSSYRILVHPGTYVSESTLTGKNTGASGAAILIQNAVSEKPVLTGATVPGAWSLVSGSADVYVTSLGGAKMVTDGSERLKKVGSLNEVKRVRGAWYTASGKVYVRLRDYGDPRTRSVHVTTGNNGLRVLSVPNVMIEGFKIEHYADTAITFDNAGNSSARSVWVNDIGNRGSTDAGVLFKASPNNAALNIIATTIYGSGIRADTSTSLDIYNASMHHVVYGIDLVGSTKARLQNNVFGSAFEDPIHTDSASRSGLVSTKNTYWNPSGALGEINGSAKYSIAALGAAAGGESGSNEADPRYRSSTSRESDKVNFLHNTVRDTDASLFNGQAWSNNTNAANLRWDQGFMFETYLDMYRATADLRWLEKIVTQADNVWDNCYQNAASPGAGDDGFCGWSTKRYARAMLKPDDLVSANGAELQIIDSAGQAVLGDLGIYGPGNGDGIVSRKLELRFTSYSTYDIWDVAGTPVSVATGRPYPGGFSQMVVDDPILEQEINYDVKFQFCCTQNVEYPAPGDKFLLETKAKKELEYENIEGGLLAPLIEFALEVKNDPTIQNLPVAGSTYLQKANEYITKVDSNIYPKWELYFKDLRTASGVYGTRVGGLYRWPTDEQYAVPGNTLPVNQTTDLGQLWVRMYQATGGNKYFVRAKQVADYLKSELEVRTAPDGKQFYYWNYYEPRGTWDSWDAKIPEDVNHGGTVVKFVEAAREAAITFTNADLVLFGNTFSSQLWDPAANTIYWFLDRTTPGSVAARIYYFHSWLNVASNDDVARLVYDTYHDNSYSTLTGVVYQMMSEAALYFARLEGTQNYRVRAGSPAVRSGNPHSYDRDFDGRSRSGLGTFDRGAYSYIFLDRLAGANRYLTAIEISKSQFTEAGKAGAVLLARGDQFADGLAGAPLAAQENAPILLTPTNALQPEVLTEIQRVLPKGKTVWLLGGTSAISETVAQALEAAGYETQRLAGADRYATAVEVAKRLEHLTDVFIASGTNFPDALAASSIAARDRAAIVLTTKDKLPDVSASFLGSTPAVNLHIVGGTAVISNTVANAADAYGTIDRTAGKNRYETAVLLAEAYYPNAASVSFATGTTFPDSLAAGPLVGGAQVGAPLLLVQPDQVPQEVAAYLSDYGPQVSGGLLFGGTSAVSAAVESTLESSL